MVRKLLIILMTFSVFSNLKAQDVHFSQFSENAMMLNPAHAGLYKGDFRAYLNYKNQWAAISKVYQTYAVSADFIMFKNNSDMKATGIGISAYQDIAGASKTKTTRVDLNLSQTIYLSAFSDISLGIGGTYMSMSANYVGLQWGTQYNGVEYVETLPTNESFTGFNENIFDFSAGLIYRRFDRRDYPLEVGISAYHLTQPKIGIINADDNLPMKLTFHASKEFDIPKTSLGYVLSLYASSQRTARELNVGFLIRKNYGVVSKYTGYYKNVSLYLGGYYRFGDAAIAMVKMKMYQKYTVGLSYDFNISKLLAASNLRGGPELSFSYTGTIFRYNISNPKSLD